MHAPSFIVCGAYGPGCVDRLAPLQQRLNAFGVPHDFVDTGQAFEDRASPARAKPLHVRDAIERHPASTVIFLDAGCRFVGTLQDLERLAGIKGDVGIRMRTIRESTRALLVAADGATLVLKPTTEARVFVQRWIEASAAAPPDRSDQDNLSIAVGRLPMVSITNIGVEFCAEPQDRYPRPVILHERPTAAPVTAGARLAKIVGRMMSAKRT